MIYDVRIRLSNLNSYFLYSVQVGFDEALRLELDVLGHSNIQTTCICPFFIQATGMFDDVNAR